MKIKINKKYNPNNDINIIHGDCLKVLNQIEDNTIQLIVTSPPYNIGKSYEKKLPLADYINSQKEVISICSRKIKDEGSICWQVGNYIENNKNEAEIYPLDIILYDLFKQNGLKLRNRIVWHFGHGQNVKYRFSGRHETILWFTKTDKYVFNLDDIRVDQKYPGKRYYKGPKKGDYSGNELGKNPTDIWNLPNVKANHIEKTDHPCQFPLALVKRLIKGLSDQNDIVFDPYLGSGTSVAAAVQLGRKAIGSELNKKYCEIALKRTQQALDKDKKLPERGEEPPYVPPKNTKLTTNPWK
jgi:adenine-specific DNA-methyltransferase